MSMAVPEGDGVSCVCTAVPEGDGVWRWHSWLPHWVPGKQLAALLCLRPQPPDTTTHHLLVPWPSLRGRAGACGTEEEDVPSRVRG